MAYDPKDPADQKILKDAVDAAKAELEAEHETAVAGLKQKNTDLLAKLAKAREGQGDPAEVARLEAEVERLTTENTSLTKDNKKLAKENETVTANYNNESGFTKKLLIDNGLNDALVANNIAPHFLPAAKAMLAGQVSIKVDGENRSAVIGDKSLGDFVKEWSSGDQGKHFVAAQANGGGGAGGSGSGSGGGKTATRSEFDAMSQGQRAEFSKAGGKLVDG